MESSIYLEMSLGIIRRCESFHLHKVRVRNAAHRTSFVLVRSNGKPRLLIPNPIVAFGIRSSTVEPHRSNLNHIVCLGSRRQQTKAVNSKPNHCIWDLNPYLGLPWFGAMAKSAFDSSPIIGFWIWIPIITFGIWIPIICFGIWIPIIAYEILIPMITDCMILQNWLILQ